MTDLYKNKYRIKSARHEHWDYRWNAAYFITICTANRKNYFGEIKNGKMEFSSVGVIADILWHDIIHHTSNVELGNFVVMPNHIHGILILNNLDIPEMKNISEENNEEKKNDSPGNHPPDPGQTLHATTPQSPQSPEIPKDSHNHKNLQMARISPKSNSISTIIRSYKSATTKHANRLGFEFEWQTRFHDHIIRNKNAYDNISNYIKNNIAKWEEDKMK